jgi:hypothetical protein
MPQKDEVKIRWACKLAETQKLSIFLNVPLLMLRPFMLYKIRYFFVGNIKLDNYLHIRFYLCNSMIFLFRWNVRVVFLKRRRYIHITMMTG